MRIKNIKVGEWAFDKNKKQLVKVYHIDIGDRIYASGHNLILINCPPSQFRKPRISDLNAGDVFDWDGDEFEMLDPNGDFVRVCRNKDSLVCCIPSQHLTEKARIISLASEKPEAKCIEGDPAEELAEIKAMMQKTASDKLNAEMGAVEAENEQIYFERIIFDLYRALDQIDTASDIAKGNDDLYRNLVYSLHKKRFKIVPEKLIAPLYDKYSSEINPMIGPREPSGSERKVLKRWLNIYETSPGNFLRETREKADRYSSKKRIACVEIEIPYYEGEGL
jgi:hypothetical protein